MGKVICMDKLGCIHVWFFVDDDYIFQYNAYKPTVNGRASDELLQFDFDKEPLLSELDDEESHDLNNGYDVWVADDYV